MYDKYEIKVLKLNPLTVSVFWNDLSYVTQIKLIALLIKILEICSDYKLNKLVFISILNNF